MFCSPTQISWHKTEWAKKKSSQVHPGHENIYIFIIYIKCLLFNPICTLFTRRLGNEVLRNEAPLHGVTPKYSRKKKSEVTKKMCNPKINPPKQKGQKKNFFPAQASFRPIAPSISTS